MRAVQPQGIFINYRHDDAGAYARLVKLRLSESFPGLPVFMDLDSIEAGADFAEAIDAALASCLVLVALIGRQWLAAAGEDGQRRLDSPDDFVRLEIATALERGVRVIPVLVDGAAMPRQDQLPPDLQKLARLHALEMGYRRIEYDETRLVTSIERLLVGV